MVDDFYIINKKANQKLKNTKRVFKMHIDEEEADQEIIEIKKIGTSYEEIEREYFEREEKII